MDQKIEEIEKSLYALSSVLSSRLLEPSCITPEHLIEESTRFIDEMQRTGTALAGELANFVVCPQRERVDGREIGVDSFIVDEVELDREFLSSTAFELGIYGEDPGEELERRVINGNRVVRDVLNQIKDTQLTKPIVIERQLRVQNGQFNPRLDILIEMDIGDRLKSKSLSKILHE